MKVKYLVGYMLGNNNHVVANGEQWGMPSEQVWVCKTMDVAKGILMASQSKASIIRPVWTTIYRVHAENIECSREDSAFYYNVPADKIIVGTPVHYQEPPRITERDLLKNARRIRASFMKLTHANECNFTKKER